jgi:hypothetical protein
MIKSIFKWSAHSFFLMGVIFTLCLMATPARFITWELVIIPFATLACAFIAYHFEIVFWNLNNNKKGA